MLAVRAKNTFFLSLFSLCICHTTHKMVWVSFYNSLLKWRCSAADHAAGIKHMQWAKTDSNITFPNVESSVPLKEGRENNTGMIMTECVRTTGKKNSKARIRYEWKKPKKKKKIHAQIEKGDFLHLLGHLLGVAMSIWIRIFCCLFQLR